VRRSQLLAVVREAIDKATSMQRSVAVLMIRLKPKDRLRLFTQDHAEAHLEKAFAGLAQLLRSEDLFCVVGVRQVCVVLPDLPATAQAFLAAHKLSRELSQATRELPGDIWDRALIGISCFPDQAEDPDSLLLRADAAASRAEQSEDGICLFERQPNEGSDEQLPILRAQVLECLRSNAFDLAYQPQLDLWNGRCESAEALLRATLTDGKPLPSPLLVAAAEQVGRVGFLTGCVLNAALRQISLWMKSGLRMRISVNLSTHNLRDRDFPDIVARSLGSWGVTADCLTLEIVESSMIHSFSEAAASLRRLKELGVKLAIDDFGTGYSCLAYLRQLPLDELKVDRSFVRSLNQSHEDRRLVQATIDLAHNFGLRAVAEGVEDEATLRALQGMGCDMIQGYVLSPALPAEGFTRWLDGFASGRKGEGAERCELTPPGRNA
jgi:EAL domain-containing protein (putative c-di-GMP-specific phosphodiesterase class I)/GGDEF domain-containing protein